jgi:hypothetical protein
MTVDTDLFVVMGLVLALLAIPSIIGAKAEARIPYFGLGCFVVGAAMLAAGVLLGPNGYSLARLPYSFIEILGRILN